MWALFFPSNKIVLKEVGPWTLAGIRFLIPMPLILLFYSMEKKERPEKNGKEKSIRYLVLPEVLMLMGFAFFVVILPTISLNYGMQTTPSGLSSIIQGSGPIFGIMFASFFLKERLTGHQIFGVVVAFIGSTFLITEGNLGFGGSTAGKLLVLLSAVSYAASGIFGKKLLMKFHPVEITFIAFLIGGPILVIIAFLLEDPFQLIGLEMKYWGHILFISIFPTCLAFICWYKAMKFLPLSKLVIPVFLVPVMAVMFSFVFLGEVIGLFSLLTGGMVIAGVVVSQIGGLKGEKGLGK